MEHQLAARVAVFVLQLAVVLLAAKLAGELATRVGQPAVVGELLAGTAIGPHALGGLAVPPFGPLFPTVEGPVPVSPELYALSQLAAVILLFSAGLETDLPLFLTSLGPATLVGLGGVLLPFVAGAATAVLGGVAPGFTHPLALFLGAVLTATSVGITARVLGDLDAMNTPEAVTVLAAAVVDDVLAIMALALAIGAAETGSLSAWHMVVAGIKAFGVWAALTTACVAGGRWIESVLATFRAPGARVALALALAFLAAFVAEAFGLAMIIGAYSAGLGLSARPLGRRLEHELKAVSEFLVPVFFVVVGMLVDLAAIGGNLALGLVVTMLAIITKLLGSGAPAFVLGFNALGAARIGVGMLPRGEVALIIASAGLAAGTVGPAIFGVAVLMTLVTTLIAPVLLVLLFRRPKPGRRSPAGGEPAT